MDVLPSSEFRKTYASLTNRTKVTVNGHVIGEWTPTSPIILGMLVYADGTTEGTAFDDSKSQTVPGFSTRPFTPVPKVRRRG